MTQSEAGPTAPTPSLRLQALGIALVVLSTIAIAIVPTFAKLAYDGGSNTLTVITARSIFTVVLAWLAMVILRHPIQIARKPMLISLGTGVFYAIHLYGFLGAVAFIPVNTAILIFFIHPILVGIVSGWLGDEPISARMIGALTAAFLGLGLAIGFTFDNLNFSGILLASSATIAGVFVIIGNGRAVKQAGGLAVVFYMMLSAVLVLALLFVIFGDLALPKTAMGWIGFSGVAIGSTIGTLTFFCAVPILGAVRATMISNIEPLLGIIFAVLILGERIAVIQGIGIAMVLSAIVAVEIKPNSASTSSDRATR